MNWYEVVRKCQNKISNKGILIEYSLFFNEDSQTHCKFVIDENEELKELDNVMLKLMKKDRNAEIYVSAYNTNFIKERAYIYADTLWVNSELDVEELYDFFRNCKNIEPSDIALLAKDETIDGEIALVVSEENKMEDYISFIGKRELNMIKSLYWD